MSVFTGSCKLVLYVMHGLCCHDENVSLASVQQGPLSDVKQSIIECCILTSVCICTLSGLRMLQVLPLSTSLPAHKSLVIDL